MQAMPYHANPKAASVPVQRWQPHAEYRDEAVACRAGHVTPPFARRAVRSCHGSGIQEAGHAAAQQQGAVPGRGAASVAMVREGEQRVGGCAAGMVGRENMKAGGMCEDLLSLSLSFLLPSLKVNAAMPIVKEGEREAVILIAMRTILCFVPSLIIAAERRGE